MPTLNRVLHIVTGDCWVIAMAQAVMLFILGYEVVGVLFAPQTAQTIRGALEAIPVPLWAAGTITTTILAAIASSLGLWLHHQHLHRHQHQHSRQPQAFTVQ